MEELMVEPLHDRVIVKRVDIEQTSKGGIILGEIERDRETGYGKVVAVGKGRRTEDAFLPMSVEIGDLIAFRENMPIRVSFKGEFFGMLRESDVFFIVKDEGITEKPYTQEGKEYQQMAKQL